MADIFSAVYPILCRGQRVGEVAMSKKGSLTVFEAASDILAAGEGTVLRLEAVCGKSRAPLGIPAPEGGKLRLLKTLSPLEISRRGITDIEYFILTDGSEDPEEEIGNNEKSAWRPEYDPGRLFTDPELKFSCENIIGALISERDGDTLLAVPAEPSRPFPLMPVFLFGEAMWINGLIYVVFKVKNGEIIG